MYLAITNYDLATTVDHTGWSEVMSSGMFAQWLILPCGTTSKGFMFAFSLCNNKLNPTIKQKATVTSAKSIGTFAIALQSAQ